MAGSLHPGEVENGMNHVSSHQPSRAMIRSQFSSGEHDVQTVLAAMGGQTDPTEDPTENGGGGGDGDS